MTNTRITPRDILELSHRDPTVRFFVERWLDGYIAWDAMLMELVSAQSQQNEFNRQDAIKHMENEPPKLIFSNQKGE